MMDLEMERDKCRSEILADIDKRLKEQATSKELQQQKDKEAVEKLRLEAYVLEYERKLELKLKLGTGERKMLVIKNIPQGTTVVRKRPGVTDTNDESLKNRRMMDPKAFSKAPWKKFYDDENLSSCSFNQVDVGVRMIPRYWNPKLKPRPKCRLEWDDFEGDVVHHFCHQYWAERHQHNLWWYGKDCPPPESFHDCDLPGLFP
jgi:hypothetical protein